MQHSPDDRFMWYFEWSIRRHFYFHFKFIRNYDYILGNSWVLIRLIDLHSRFKISAVIHIT